MHPLNRPARRQLLFLAGALACLLALLTACDDDSLKPGPEEVGPLTLQATAPESLITGLMRVYNDVLHDAAERHAFYADLFPPAAHDSLPGFIFHFQSVDVEPGEEATWGLDAELSAHENMFNAQAARDIYSLALSLGYAAPEPLGFPEPGQEDWVMIFVSNCYLRLMFNPQDGLQIDGGQAEFILAPADDRWYIVDWTDLPRP